MIKPLPIQERRGGVYEAAAQRNHRPHVRSSARIQKQHEKARLDRFGSLPPELKMEVTKWMNLEDLGNLILSSNAVSELASTRKKAISRGIQAHQYPELYKTFGMTGEETEDQKWYLVAEKENREWWLRDDEKRYGEVRRCEERQDPSRESRLPLTPECVGRIKFFAALAEDMDRTAAALKEADCITTDTENEGLTRRALLLCLKLQWIDRPGLERLCSQDDLVHDYLEIRQEMYDAEAPEVRGRFREIMRLVGSRVWKRLKLWCWTRQWSLNYKKLITGQQYIGWETAKIWLRDVTTELAVEVVSKIGLDRAIKLDYTCGPSEDMVWINETVIDRLEELFDDLEKILRKGCRLPAYGFGVTVGLLPEDIVDEGIEMFGI